MSSSYCWPRWAGACRASSSASCPDSTAGRSIAGAASGWRSACWSISGRHLWPRDAAARFRAIPLVALCVSAGFFAIGSTLYVTSLTLVSTATISVIGASSPIFTGLLSPWVTGERPGLAAWIAAALAMCGRRHHRLGWSWRRQARRNSRLDLRADLLCHPDPGAATLPRHRHGSCHLRRRLS